MAGFRQFSFSIFAILGLLCLSALATEYTRFEDLPKCGQVCLRDSISYAMVKADCGTSLACACKSGKYSDYLLSCLGEHKPCKEAPTYGDVCRYGSEYYCNATSDQRVLYTVDVGGAKKTLTLQANEVSSNSHATTSDIPIAATSSKATASIITVTDLMSTSSEETSDTKHGESTRPTATSSMTASSSASSTNSDSPSTHSDSSSSHSDSSSSTSGSSLSDHTTSSISSQSEEISSAMTVVDASTTIMGHTVTVKSTTLVTATVNSGTGPCRLESVWRGFEEKTNIVIGICVASVVTLAFLMLR